MEIVLLAISNLAEIAFGALLARNVILLAQENQLLTLAHVPPTLTASLAVKLMAAPGALTLKAVNKRNSDKLTAVNPALTTANIWELLVAPLAKTIVVAPGADKKVVAMISTLLLV